MVTEAEALSAIKSFEKKTQFSVRTGKSKFYTMRDYSAVMAPLMLRARLLLQLQFQNVVFDYIDKESGFCYFAYLPTRRILLDFYQSPWHQGPNGLARSYNPAIETDVQFKKYYINRKHSITTWMYRAKAFTWAGSDYKKLCYSNLKRLPYYIYWSLASLESLVDVDTITYSRQLMQQHYINTKLQALAELKLVRWLESYNASHAEKFPYASKSCFEMFEMPSRLVQSIIT